ARRVRFDLGDDGAGCVIYVEELGFIGGHVADSDADIAVVHFAVLDEAGDRWLHDLGGDGEAHAGEASSLGDQEGVDAYDLAMGVDQRPAGVAGIDGRVGLDEAAGRTAVSRDWI